MELKKQIEKEFETVQEDTLTLLNLTAENYFDAVMESLRLMVERGEKGVYVTVSRPHKYLRMEMRKRGIRTDGILFLDCISSMAGERDDMTCTYVENPSSLEEISMHIGSLLDKIDSGKKFLIMDSFSTFLIYNGKNSMKEFAMFLINKLRLEGVGGILVILEREAPDDLKQILIAMCDRVIYI